MKDVTPKVYLIAETKMVFGPIDEYLASIGAADFETHAGSDAERLVEIAGRLCYRSFKPGLNPNVTKVREGNAEYLDNIIKQKHGSVLEHASATFIFQNVSRVFTHELVRHRVGVGISQESMRYVRVDDIPFWFPESLKGDAEISARATGLLLQMEAFQDFMRKRLALDDEASGFNYKKLMTSAMRRFLPDGIGTSIMWTANMRTLRHVLELRTSKSAEEEIRLVFDRVGHICHSRYQNIFGDMIRNTDGEWTSLRGASKI